MEDKTPRGGRGKEAVAGEVAPTRGKGAEEIRAMGEMVVEEEITEVEEARRSLTWSRTSQRKPRSKRR